MFRARARFSPAVSLGSRPEAWKTQPIDWRINARRPASSRSSRRRPKIVTSPSSWARRPPTTPIKVVLPDSDRPAITWSSPSAASMSTPARIVRRLAPPPTLLVSPRARIAGSLIKRLIDTTPQSDLVAFQVGADEPTSAKAFHIGPRKLNPAGTIHDQELVRDQIAGLLEPSRLGARPTVTDLDDAIGVAFDAGVMGDDDSGRPGFPEQLSEVSEHVVGGSAVGLGRPFGCPQTIPLVCPRQCHRQPLALSAPQLLLTTR